MYPLQTRSPSKDQMAYPLKRFKKGAEEIKGMHSIIMKLTHKNLPSTSNNLDVQPNSFSPKSSLPLSLRSEVKNFEGMSVSYV